MLPYIADMDPMGNDIIKPPKGDENGAVLEPFDQIRHGIQKMAGLYGKTIFMVQFFGGVATFCSWFGTLHTPGSAGCGQAATFEIHLDFGVEPFLMAKRLEYPKGSKLAEI
jgi:hypothetical protein